MYGLVTVTSCLIFLPLVLILFCGTFFQGSGIALDMLIVVYVRYGPVVVGFSLVRAKL